MHHVSGEGTCDVSFDCALCAVREEAARGFNSSCNVRNVVGKGLIRVGPTFCNQCRNGGVHHCAGCVDDRCGGLKVGRCAHRRKR